MKTTHKQKKRMASRMLSREERRKGVTPFNSRAWIDRAFERREKEIAKFQDAKK